MPSLAFPTKKQLAAALAVAAVLIAPRAEAATTWNWSYSGTGIAAAGTLLTDDTPDASGFYEITGITGSRNGDAITGLYPTGTAIPGNEPYALDNLIRIGGTGQITVHGFGFSLASGGASNPYFADFLPTPAYSEVFTTASSFSEVPITFVAAPVPEPATAALLLAGIGALASLGYRRRRQARAR